MPPSPEIIDDVIRGPTRRVLTLMFTDIEGSTRLWEQHPDDMEPAVIGHNGLVSSIVDAAGGRILRFMGDGALAVFLDAGPALGAAVDIQRAFSGRTWSGIGELRLRIGLNTGACRLDDGELLGRPPNLAARLESAAHGGQILLADSTARAAHGWHRPGEQLFDLGRYDIRGFDEPVVVHSVVADGLPSVFPPLRTPYLGFDELPSDDSALYGRDELVGEVVDLLHRHRLVTLWGPGGVGKTRVALRVAHRVRRPYEHGVRFVDLAGLDESWLVIQALAAAVRAQPRADETARETVLRVLRYARVLLVLDNCEVAVDGVRDLVIALGDIGSTAHVLATSREPLCIDGECVVAIPPLAVPSGDATTVAQVSAADSVRLFVERARTRDPRFVMDERTADVVARICRSLDGLPVALELAAARLDVDSLETLLDRLPDGLGQLQTGPGGSRPGSSAVQRLPWSLDRLAAPDRALFRRLSVFAGSVPRDVAVRMADGPGARASFDRLVRTSMVMKEADTPDRFRLLAVARALASADLDEAERQAALARHARLMLERAQTFGALLHTRDEGLAVAALRADFPDHRAAFRYLADRDAVNDIAMLVVALLQFAQFQPRPEVYAWAAWAAERIESTEQHAAEIIGAAALGAWYSGDLERAIDRASRAIALAERLGGSTIWARTALVNALGYAGRLEHVEKHFLALVQELYGSSDDFWKINGLGFHAIGLALFGQLAEATERAERALAMARRLANPDCTQWALYSLGRVLSASNPGAAAAAFEAAMAAAREVGSRFNIGLSMVEWVGVQRRLGHDRNAIAGTLDLLDLLAISGNRSQLSQVLREAGLVLADGGLDEVGAAVLLARQGLPEMPRPPHEVPEDEARLADLRQRLGYRWNKVLVRAKATTEHELILLCQAELTDMLHGLRGQELPLP